MCGAEKTHTRVCQHMMDKGFYGKDKAKKRDTEGRRGQCVSMSMCVCVCLSDCLSVYSVTLCSIPLRGIESFPEPGAEANPSHEA